MEMSCGPVFNKIIVKKKGLQGKGKGQMNKTRKKDAVMVEEFKVRRLNWRTNPALDLSRGTSLHPE